MKKHEFKQAMVRGLGRCVVAAQQDPDRYRDSILWACQRDIAYDTQCEGTRAWYVYMLACAGPDREPFVRAAAEALERCRPEKDRDLAHLSELLMLFARDGHDLAGQALEGKYRQLLTALRERQGRSGRGRVFYELAALEQLAVVLTEDRSSFLRIARDLGRLYREKPWMEDGDFCRFFDLKGS